MNEKWKKYDTGDKNNPILWYCEPPVGDVLTSPVK